MGKLTKKLKRLNSTMKTVEAKTVGPQVSTSSATQQNAPFDDSLKNRVKVIGIKESDKRFHDARQFNDKQAIENILDTLKLPEAKLIIALENSKRIAADPFLLHLVLSGMHDSSDRKQLKRVFRKQFCPYIKRTFPF